MAILSLMTAVATVLSGCGSGKKGYHPPEGTETARPTDSLRTLV
jgi:uncharacterized protein YceK